jgi:hypothetical protein
MNEVACKVCNIGKGADASHWKIVSIERVTRDPRVLDEQFQAMEFGDFAARYLSTLGRRTVYFACGEQHALILFERWLATKSFEPGPQVSDPIEVLQGEQHGNSNHQA